MICNKIQIILCNSSTGLIDLTVCFCLLSVVVWFEYKVDLILLQRLWGLL